MAAENLGTLVALLTAAASLLVVVFKGGGVVRETQLTRAEVGKANDKLDIIVPEQAKIMARLDSVERRVGELEKITRE